MSSTSIKPIFGAAQLGTTPKFPGDVAEETFKVLEAAGCDTIDTTHDWPGSEAWLGKVKAGTRFTVNSKTPGGIVPGQSTATGVVEHARELAGYIGAENVDVYVIHAPDPTIPLAETLKGMDEAHRLGFFKRMGLSNFSAAEVEEAYAICKEHGYVLPTVYEGNYSAVARKADTLLLPTLRRLGIAFYAYSPMAGGLLTKTPAQLGERGPGAGRFAGEGFGATMYNALYNKPSYMYALDHWAEAAKSVGVTKAELAYRWVACDSPLSAAHGDAILFGGSTPAQVAEVLAWLKKGSLGADARAKIDEIWQMVEADAPMDNYQSFWKDNSAKILAENPRALGVAPSLSR